MNVQDAWRRWGPVVGDKWGAGVPSPAQPSAAVGDARERSGQHVTDTAGQKALQTGRQTAERQRAGERAEAERGQTERDREGRGKADF